MNIPTLEESLYLLNLTCAELLRQSAGIELRVFIIADSRLDDTGNFSLQPFIELEQISEVYILDNSSNKITLDYSNEYDEQVVINIPMEYQQATNIVIIKLDYNA